MDTYTQKAQQIISQNIYMTLATATKDGKPWISPVFFAYDDFFNFYWVSSKKALHSKLIRKNPQVAITIFDSSASEGEGDAVYFETTVKELKTQSEVMSAISTLNNRITVEEFRIKNINEVTGDGIWRIYKAQPIKAWKLSEGEIINGQYVDNKIEIELNNSGSCT